MKALFFDIDGTLVSFTTHKIPQSAVDAIAQAKQNGCKIIIATGRPMSIVNNLGQLQSRGLIDGYITMNGGYTFVEDKVLFENPIPNEDLKQIIPYCQKLGVSTVYMTNDECMLLRNSKEFDDVFYKTLNIDPVIEGTEADEVHILKNGHIYQITTFINTEEEAPLLPYIPGSETTRWHPAFVDIMGKGNTKSHGIKTVCKHYNIKQEDTYAFGDGGNDISMLTYAGTGVAMGNASDVVKQSANFVAPHIDEDGLAFAMKQLSII